MNTQNEMNSTILIFTANDADQVRLSQLANEGKEIQRLLNGSPRKNYDVVLSPESSTDDIIKELNVQNRTVEILHYAGHSDGNSILLNDTQANADALAKKLQSIGTLKLVFINGCSSKGQVQFFHAAGIPFVIATSRPIDDDKAFWFAKQFYNYLTIGRSLQKSFEATILDANFQKKNVPFLNERAIGRIADIQTDAIPWALYIREGAETQDYSLPFNQNKLSATPELNHKNFLDKIIFALASVEDYPNLKNIKNLAKKIEMVEVQQGKKVSELLKILPYTMSLCIQKIVAEIERDSEYYRLQLYNYTFLFETILHFTASILMAQVWQHKKNISAQNLEKFLEFGSFWKKSRLDQSPNDYKFIILKMIDWLNSLELSIPFQKNDIERLIVFLNSNDFEAASEFFYRQKSIYNQRIRLSDTEAIENCFKSQEYLNQTFYAFKNLAVNNMASVRGINVMNFRHVETNFDNVVSKLIINETEQSPVLGSKMLENKSVLWYSSNDNDLDVILDIPDKLNLFPFIIDLNAFTEKYSSEVALYLFIGYFGDASGINCYHFVSVNDNSIIWKFDENQNKISSQHIGQTTSLTHQANHLMVRAGEFKKYLSEFKAIFLNA